MAFLPTHSAYQAYRAYKKDVVSYHWGRIYFVVMLMIYDTDKKIGCPCY